jgi:hypothetical protein
LLREENRDSGEVPPRYLHEDMQGETAGVEISSFHHHTEDSDSIEEGLWDWRGSSNSDAV